MSVNYKNEEPKKLDREVVGALNRSKRAVGPLIPILISSKTGRMIDGAHRRAANGLWPVTKLPLDEKQGAVARLALNAIRHPPEDLDYDMLGAILRSEGVPRNKIAREIANLTGISYHTVIRHLQEGFKQPTGTRYHTGGRRKKEKQAPHFTESVEANATKPEEVEATEEPEAVEEAEREPVEAETVQSTPEPTTKKERERPAGAFRDWIKPWSDAIELLSFIVEEPTGILQANYRALSAEDRNALKAKAVHLREILDRFEEILK